ncbi:hypothetical protein [Chryseobacterium sp. R2A-55]|uniref:hypothetical protein n=1 Tax=Chryseobacterium sp. R2A-55 TaxID=2744445 RepID=UPI001F1E77C8|nr:hypothetical protein [Chryseobacterium sp. R2A-55]
MTVKFYLKNPKEGKNTILVRVREGRRLDITSSTSENVNLQDWDSKSGACLTVIEEFKNGKLVQSRDSKAKERLVANSKINRELEKIRESIEEAYKKSDKLNLNKIWLQQIIFPERFAVEEEEKPYTLMNAASDYLSFKEEEFRKGKVKEAIIKKSKSLMKILERLFESEGIEPPLVTEVDASFYRTFDNYCTFTEEYLPSYTGRNFKLIKTMVFHAAANGHPYNAGLRHIKIKVERRKFPTLSFEELELIEKHGYDNDYLVNARDWLIIGAFCGQRASDLLRFSTSMIEEEIIEGVKTYFICFQQEKTGKILRLALHHKIVAILEKRNWNFPRQISDQRFNEYIKEVVKLAGINEMCEGGISSAGKNGRVRKRYGMYPKHMLITSHCCRRSFCTNFYGLIETSTLMVASGHSTEKQFREYIQDVDRKQAETFAKAINTVTTLKIA